MTTSERIYALNSFLEVKPLSLKVKIFGICAGFANVTWENQISRTCAWKQDNTYHSQSSQISQAMDIIFATQVNKTCNGDNSLTWWSHPLRLTSMLFWWHQPCLPFRLVHPWIRFFCVLSASLFSCLIRVEIMIINPLNMRTYLLFKMSINCLFPGFSWLRVWRFAY